MFTYVNLSSYLPLPVHKRVKYAYYKRYFLARRAVNLRFEWATVTRNTLPQE